MRRQGLAVLAMLAIGLGGCETASRLDDTVASGPVPIAFEGFVGVPAAVGNQVAQELLRASTDRRFALVPPTDRSARFTMRGYIAPQAEAGATSVSYVWDLFDRAGQRARRAAGDVRIAGAQSDPWLALSGPGLRDLAQSSVAAIERTLTARPAETASASAAPPVATPGTAPSASQEQRPASRRLAIEAVSGLESAQEAQWRAAARQKLGELGYTLVEPGQPADARILAEATVNPPEAGRRKLAFVWHVSDNARREVGQIRLMTMVDEQVFPGRSGPTLQRAVEEALPGLVALVPPRH